MPPTTEDAPGERGDIPLSTKSQIMLNVCFSAKEPQQAINNEKASTSQTKAWALFPPR